MSFVVGDRVWFKKLGRTPFVVGSATDEALPVGGGNNALNFGGASLGGRGKAEITAPSTKANSGLSDAQGVPTIQSSGFPDAIDSTRTVLQEGEDAPTAAPTATDQNVYGSVDPGNHTYKYTFVTAGGESAASPASSTVDSDIIVPPPGALLSATAGLLNTGDHTWKVAFVTAGGTTLPSAVSPTVTTVDGTHSADLTLPLGPTGTTSRTVYRNKIADQTHWFLAATVGNNTATTLNDGAADSALTTAAPTVATQGTKVSVGGIAPGPTGTTGRKVYRNKIAAQTTWSLLTTLSDNTTESYTDNTADASLSAGTAPTKSTSGFTGSTIGSAGTNIGVKEQTVVNVLSPRTVTVDGPFVAPTPAARFPTGDNLDEAPVDDGTNTIGKSDPSAPGGSASKGRAIASGTKVPLSGLNPYGAGKIDVKGKTVGVRLPSSEEGPGVVIQKVTVVNAGKTPDGTLVRAGDVTYWVNWGSPAGSQPHSTKWRNRHRVTMHAEADLVAI